MYSNTTPTHQRKSRFYQVIIDYGPCIRELETLANKDLNEKIAPTRIIEILLSAPLSADQSEYFTFVMEAELGEEEMCRIAYVINNFDIWLMMIVEIVNEFTLSVMCQYGISNPENFIFHSWVGGNSILLADIFSDAQLSIAKSLRSGF